MWALRSIKQLCINGSASPPPPPSISPNGALPSSPSYAFLQRRYVVYNKITKNKLLLNKHRDAAFENSLDDEKKMNLMKRIIKLLLKQPEKKMLLRYMLRRGGYLGLVKPQKMSDILQKYPRIIRIYRNPEEVNVWVTLASPILQLLEDEQKMKRERAHLAAERLRKVLMLSSTRKIRLDRINFIREELGLPEDFKKSVIKANPHLFKLVIAKKDVGKVSPSVKLLEWDPQYAIPAIEAFRENPDTTSGLSESEKRKKAYSFPINLPPGFKIKKGFRIKMRKWQELPYRSPYDDTSGLDLQSDEAFKRAVAVLHEFLHITVEKRTQVDRLAHLRGDYKLPQKLGITVLQNPGIFYMSIKGNVQTIFLREAYRKGQVIEKDATHSLKKRFMELIRMGSKSLKPKKDYDNINSDTSDDETESYVKSNRIETDKKVWEDGGRQVDDEDGGMQTEDEHEDTEIVNADVYENGDSDGDEDTKIGDANGDQCEDEWIKDKGKAKVMEGRNLDESMESLCGRGYPNNDEDEDCEEDSEEESDEMIKRLETMDEPENEDASTAESGEEEEIKEAHGSWRR